MPTLLQLSDTHLLADPDERLRGIPTTETLSQVLMLARAQHPSIARIVLTGDLAHDERPETYRVLHRVLGPDTDRCWLLPGNHDDRQGLCAAFEQLQRVADERVCFVDELDGWRLVGLDSQIPGENPGQLGTEQLAWLRETLATDPLRPTLLFVHHPPVPTGHPWFDDNGLLDAGPLEAEVRRAPGIRAICHGHIHRDFTGALAGVPVLGAPSTAFQFPAHPDHGQLELRPPGARVLHLEHGRLRTEVLRLARLDPVPVPHER